MESGEDKEKYNRQKNIVFCNTLEEITREIMLPLSCSDHIVSVVIAVVLGLTFNTLSNISLLYLSLHLPAWSLSNSVCDTNNFHHFWNFLANGSTFLSCRPAPGWICLSISPVLPLPLHTRMCCCGKAGVVYANNFCLVFFSLKIFPSSDKGGWSSYP